MTITTTREFTEANRYLYDNLLVPKGWAQLDSDSDAAYFGNWADPVSLTLFSYVEGDCTTTECSTTAEFAAEVRKVAAWHTTHDRWLGIDYGTSDEARQRWEALGLADLFHPSPVEA
jgi:hypothetical protein